MEQLLALSQHDTISDSELASFMQCALIGPSRASLVDALLKGLNTGRDPASPTVCLHVALRWDLSMLICQSFPRAFRVYC